MSISVNYTNANNEVLSYQWGQFMVRKLEILSDDIDEFQLSPRQHYIHRSLRADDRLLFAEHEFSLSFRTHHQWTAVRCRTPDHASDLGWKPDSCFERAFQCPNEHRLLSHH